MLLDGCSGAERLTGSPLAQPATSVGRASSPRGPAVPRPGHGTYNLKSPYWWVFILSSEQIIDARDYDPDRPGGRRRLWRHILLPASFIVMTIIIVCALAYYSYNAHREAALELTEDLLIAIDKRIATEVEAYLSPASRLVELVADLGARETFAVNEQSALEPLARQVLQTYEQLAMFNIADTNGNFIMPKKMPGGHIDTKLITRTDGKIDSRWLRRNATGEVIAIDPLPDDTYDPRERPWYTGATRSGGMYWTNVYIFYTDRKPGITAAYPITNAAGDNLGVMGIDIELGELCAFLDQLEIGDTGTPMIIDRHGMIVAFPDIQRMIQYDGGKPSTVNITDMGDPVLLRAYNTFQVEGPGHRELELDGRVYLNTVAALPDPFGRDWHVMIVVPADEFVGFVAENNRRNLMTSIAIVGFASLLALVMISQGLRADRNARAVQQHREQLEQQCEVFAALTAEQGYFDVPLSDACRVLATSAAPVIDADFVGIWAVRPNGDGLVCRCRYNRDNNGITDGAVLLRQDQPELLGAIAEGKVLDISDAARSKLTRRLPELDQQLNARSLLVCPVTLGQRVIGAVSFSRRQAQRWSTEDVALGRAVAGLAAVRLSMDTQTPTLAGSQPTPDTNGADEQNNKASSNQRSATRMAISQALDLDDIRSCQIETIEGAAVLAVHVERPLHNGHDEADCLQQLNRLVALLAPWVSRQGAHEPFAMGHTVVYVFEQPSADARPVELAADAAIGLQQYCASRRDDRGSLTRHVSFGIDFGRVSRASLGERGTMRDLSGSAVQGAVAMAVQAATGGGIQVTSHVYERLKEHFLLDDRGAFYMPGVGESEVFRLVDRL